MKEKTPYDYFLVNLKMTEAMVRKMQGQGSTNDTLRTQILLLQDMISNLERLQGDLTEMLNSEKPN